jgi:hypothetical protein
MPVAVSGPNFGKTFISKYKAIIYDLKKKYFYLACWKSFILRSLSIRRAIMAQSKIFFYKALIFKHN